MQRYRISAKTHTQALKELNQKVRNLNGGQPKQSANTRRPITERELDRLINETFLRTLSRFPTETELAKARLDVSGSTDKIAGVKDLLWALLNTKEFMTNH